MAALLVCNPGDAAKTVARSRNGLGPNVDLAVGILFDASGRASQSFAVPKKASTDARRKGASASTKSFGRG